MSLQPITPPSLVLSIIEQGDGSVYIHCEGNLKGANNAARVTTTLCRFADGLFEGGQQVRLAPAIVEAVL